MTRGQRTETEPDAGHVITLFFSHLRDMSDDEGAEYRRRQGELVAAARGMPGFVSVKGYTSDDGERLTVVRFTGPDEQGAWRRLAEHVEAQRAGRDRFYADYRVVLCHPYREYAWTRDGEPEP